MKLNKLVRPFLMVLALLALAIWGQKLMAARQSANAEPAERQNTEEQQDLSDAADSGEGRSESAITNEAAKEGGQSQAGDTNEADAAEQLAREKENERTRELLQKSINLLRTKSLRSNIRQRGMLFGTELIASGSYLHADGGKGGVRTELELQTTNLNLHVEMVNDGVFFFRRVKSLSENSQLQLDEKEIEKQAGPSVERINLRQIREEAVPNETWPGHWIAFGGLYLFMDQSRRCFDFGPMETKEIKGEEYDVMIGTWKPEKLASLVPAQKGSILKRHAIDWKRIPQQIPLEVEIYFCKTGDLAGFPFRIVFYRPNEELLDHVRIVPVLITEYSAPEFIETPVQADFQFNADENEVVDITEDFLISLRK